MPLQSLTFRPGINRQVTPTANEGGWSDGSLVRFKDGMAQPIGGWAGLLANLYAGACRRLHAWVTLAGKRLLALGTSSNLYLALDNTLYDITPTSFTPGLVDVPYADGYSAGSYGVGTYGTPRAGVISTGSLTLWSIDHWGEELVALSRGGTAIFNWKPTGGYTTKAAPITGAPNGGNVILTGMPERHLIVFGAEYGGSIDPLLIRWSDVEDYTSFVATATNSAGSFRLVGGSQIMGACAAQGEILVWTDAVLWAMRFQGLPYVYGFFQLGEACGLIAPNAATVMNGVAYWMGRVGFYSYAGQVKPIACTLWDDVFRNLNQQQQAKVFCASNFSYNEVTWFYPSAASLEVDRYVTLNVVDGTWYGGSMARTAWEDAEVLPYPTAVGAGQIYSHEFGADADGQPLDAYVESGLVDIASGDQMMVVNQFVPDFRDLAGTVQVTLKGQAWPAATSQRLKGPYAITATTTTITPRMRARQMAVRIESGGKGSFWRFGAPRVRVAQDGKR